MYFNNTSIIDINTMLNKKYNIYAHVKDHKYETLQEHIELALKYFNCIISEKGLEKVFLRIENEICEELSEENRACFSKIFREMIINTVTLHDMGKVNPYFQKSRLKNDLYIDESEKFKNSHHSMLSSIVFIQYYFNIIKKVDNPDRDILLHFMMINAYVISRHHGELDSWEKFKEKFKDDGEGIKLIEEYKVLYEKTLDMRINISIKNIRKIFDYAEISTEKQEYNITNCKYIYSRMMLSMLFACDFYATSEFMDGMEIKDIGVINDIDEFYKVYKDGEIYKSIRTYESECYGKNNDFSYVKDINIMRNELFLDAEKVLKENVNGNIFYLDAPTGSGKSNVATNLSFKLLEEDKTKNKIFYVYPFNTLVQQNINNLNKIFSKSVESMGKIAVINSIEPIKTDEKNRSIEYEKQMEYYKKALLNRQFLNYPMVLTTHVTMFKYLFGTLKEDIFPLHQLCNSVIVLDEIQSYKNSLWAEIITFLSSYAKIMNIKFIIMSATLPNLNKLSLLETSTVKLIKDREKYFSNPLFQDRVEVNYDLLKGNDKENELYSHVISQVNVKKKILIEFVKKKSAYEFYHRLREDYNINVDIELITGDDNLAERDRIINKVGISESMILVATQVVEAGVDIDMDIGYKNVSMLDSEEQFLGRINRSCKKSKCIVYFFNLDDSKSVYKNDVRMNSDMTILNEDMQNILMKKNFEDFYDEIMRRLKSSTEKINENNIKAFFYDKVRNCNFDAVDKKMKLIDDDYNKISVYLNSDIVIHGETVSGAKIWNEYIETIKNNKMDYAEKRVKLSVITSNMNNFIYEIKWKSDFSYNDRVGDLYYIEDGEQYFRDGKFDKEKFESGVGVFI